MALKATKPKAGTKRLKMFLFGSYKVGKTTSCLYFPKSYIIDAEKGTVHDQYVELINKNESVVLHTHDIDDVVAEVRELGIIEHQFHTIIIDPITTIESDLIEKAEKEFGAGDMRIWGKRDRRLKRLVNLLNRLDMNVIVTAHGKIDYGANMTRLGTTFDGWKRWPYVFDLIVELERRGDNRVAIVRGTRLKEFVDGEVFPWSYAEFVKRYPDIERAAKPVVLATTEQVGELNRLTEVVQLPVGQVDKWLVAAGADCLEDMEGDKIAKCIDLCKKKMEAAKA